MKFKGFLPGEVLPAENVNSVDPNNIIAGAGGYLTGGNNPSALSVWQALATGANNGKISVSIDGFIHDNIAIDLLLFKGSANQTIINQTSYNQATNIGDYGQVFTIPAGIYSINKISITTAYDQGRTSSFTTTLTVRKGNVIGSGDIVASGSLSNSFYGDYNFTEFTVKAGEVYNFKVTCDNWNYVNSNSRIIYSSSDPYSGGDSSYGAGTDLPFTVSGYNASGPTSLSDIATALQSSIRSITGKTETVVYSTDHFVISSSSASQFSKVLKLISPSSGTDITGNATEKYLDCGVNATETHGTGDDYNLMRLDSNGRAPLGTLPFMRMLGATQTRAGGTVYQNTTSKNMLVMATLNVYGNSGNSSYYGQAHIFIGELSSSLVEIANIRAGYAVNVNVPVVFIVPPGYYYKFTTASNSGGVGVSSWYETYL